MKNKYVITSCIVLILIIVMSVCIGIENSKYFSYKDNNYNITLVINEVLTKTMVDCRIMMGIIMIG